jgi:hypothetical protein
VGSAQLEAAGRVDEDRHVVGVEILREQRRDHLLGQVGREQRQEVDPRRVLGRDQDGVDRDRAAVLVDDAHLGLAVRAQVAERAQPADLGQALGQPVGQPDRERHEIGGLVAREAEHHPLVAGALRVAHVLTAGAGP